MKRIPRRLALKHAGIAIGLPMLEGMLPSGIRCRSSVAASRMVCIGVPFGFDPAPSFP